MNDRLFDYIEACPTPYHAVAHTAKILHERGFLPLCESEPWHIAEGKSYYVTRNGSSLIAFRVPTGDFSGFMMSAAHCDSPTFRIKEHAELCDKAYVRLSTEKYGGMICSSFVDRPLSVAGRVAVRTECGVRVMLVDLREISALIPNVAIHMDRTVNDGKKWDASTDMLPLYGEGFEKGTFRRRIADTLGIGEGSILSTDLMLYNPQRGVEWNGFISAPRLDDLQCAFASLTAFVEAKVQASMPVYCLFDNEEVGSQTKQGAASTFLSDVLLRIDEALGVSDSAHRQRIADSFLVSCDNAHAVHPNHPEYSDKNHTVYLNGGIVIKYNANQKYTSDAVSAALFRLCCEKAGVGVQMYANRADIAGGSTLGNIANTQVSLNTVDIGLPQLAMHSALETAGAEDTSSMVKALTRYFGSSLRMLNDGEYALS